MPTNTFRAVPIHISSLFSVAFINRKMHLNLYTSPYLHFGTACGRRDSEKNFVGV